MKRFIYSSVCASSMSHQLCSAESQGMKSPFPAGLGLLPKLSRLQAHTRHSTLTQGCLAPGWAAGQGMKLGWALLNTDKLWWALGGPPAREQLLSSAIPGIIFRSFLPTLRCSGAVMYLSNCIIPAVQQLSPLFLFQTGCNIFFNITRKNQINKTEPFLLLFF